MVGVEEASHARYFALPQHKAVIDIVIPQIANMQPLAEEAVATCDYEMCRRIILIFIQLGNDYILPVMDDSNTLKDQLLQVISLPLSHPDAPHPLLLPFHGHRRALR